MSNFPAKIDTSPSQWIEKYWPLPIVLPILLLAIAALTWNLYGIQCLGRERHCWVEQKRVVVYEIQGIEASWKGAYWETPMVDCQCRKAGGKK